MKPRCFLKTSILLFITLSFIILLKSLFIDQSHHLTINKDTLLILDKSSDVLPSLANVSTSWKRDCQFQTCFEINNCLFMSVDPSVEDQISIYVYPEYHYMYSKGRTIYRAELSTEYREMLAAVKSSRYYQPDQSKACVFMPSIDMLNQQKRNIVLISSMLRVLPWWNNGQNHVVFSMLPGQYPTYNSTPDIWYDQAMLAGSGLDSISYRKGYDISIPVYNGRTRYQPTVEQLNEHRTILLTVLNQLGSKRHLVQHFIGDTLSNVRILVLGSCQHCSQCRFDSRCGLEPKGTEWKYPNTLAESVFCLMLPRHRRDSPDFLDILMTGCVPVVLRNAQRVLPFSEVLDWNRGVVFVWEEELPQLTSILQEIPERVRKEKQNQIKFLYDRYFSSIRSITLTTLHILNGRVFPLSSAAGTYQSWNDRPYSRSVNDYFQHSYPLMPDLPPNLPSEGFTAVILSYNRIEMLFHTITSVSRAPSLAMILVVWNNIELDPPPEREWPLIDKPVKVIRSKENKLSNRFTLYESIHTSAVLSLDDDITMLTPSEIEFGYKVWLEYPKQIVGYPGRVHWYNTKEGRWLYESEWIDSVSVVLTGAAFYHKYYHYLYTHKLPNPIKQWVDDHFNCEDIVFNFMVSNYTGLPPIKVTPRKRFKCNGNCTQDGLFTDTSHFNERNECINLFAKFFDGVPLKTIKFRLDPVLFKVPDANEMNAFPDIGQL